MNRSEGPDDRFVPPGSDTDVTLDLTEQPRAGRPPATIADEELFVPEPRKPLVYKNPGGFGNTVLWLIGGALLLGAAGFGVVAAKRMFDDPAGGAGPGAAAAPAAAPAKPVTWTPVQSGDAVLVTVEASPRNARLLLDGAALESNPVRVPRGGRHTLQALADGFEPASAEILADGAKTVRLKLKRARR